jgi:hypothetical protein
MARACSARRDIPRHINGGRRAAKFGLPCGSTGPGEGTRRGIRGDASFDLLRTTIPVVLSDPSPLDTMRSRSLVLRIELENLGRTQRRGRQCGARQVLRPDTNRVIQRNPVRRTARSRGIVSHGRIPMSELRYPFATRAPAPPWRYCLSRYGAAPAVPHPRSPQVETHPIGWRLGSERGVEEASACGHIEGLIGPAESCMQAAIVVRR